jgi:N-acetylglucosamine kinase-like BadF-type ATPase
MVDMRPLNEKLRLRAVMMVASLTGLTSGDAEQLLTLSNGEIKTAVVAHRMGCVPTEARARLERCHGQLKRALDSDEIGTETVKGHFSRDTLQDPSQFLLGIDAGGTKTVVAIAHREHPSDVVASVRTGPANAADGFGAAQRELLQAIELARRSARLGAGPFAQAFVGMAGAGDESLRSALEQWLCTLALAHRVTVTHDTANVLAMVEPCQNAIALISGTGGMAFGRTASGSVARAGGWGWITCRGGSGYAVGVGALQAVVLQADGLGPATLLTGALQERLGVSDVRSLIGLIQGSKGFVPLIASLAETVAVAATQGDGVAYNILCVTAAELASLVSSVCTQLGMMSPSSYTLCIAGNLLIRSRLLQTHLFDYLKAQSLTPARVLSVPDPVLGALRAAADLTA